MKLYSRRYFTKCSLALAAFVGFDVDAALTAPSTFGTAPPISFPEGVPVPTIDQLLNEAPAAKGNEPPYRVEVETARKILDNAPTRTSPVEVARYFERLRNGEFDQQYGDDSYTYGEEWPVRANPLIVSFFDATTLRKPNGDITAWCSAFVNYCIVRSRVARVDANTLLPETKNAGALSFSGWGKETKDPKTGDLVVFLNKNKPGSGHVGFFISKTTNGVYVLGGNQMPIRTKLPDGTYDAANTGEVNTKYIPFDGHDLKLHSFRTDKSLHSL